MFVRDLSAGTTRRVSVNAGGGQGGSGSGGAHISPDGRYVLFSSDARLVAGDMNRALDVFVRDVKAGTTRRASLTAGGAQANGGSFAKAISADGRVIAFLSRAANLVPGDTNGKTDVFVRVEPAP